MVFYPACFPHKIQRRFCDQKQRFPGGFSSGFSGGVFIVNLTISDYSHFDYTPLIVKMTTPIFDRWSVSFSPSDFFHHFRRSLATPSLLLKKLWGKLAAAGSVPALLKKIWDQRNFHFQKSFVRSLDNVRYQRYIVIVN